MVLTWLADPVKVLAAMNRLAGLGCLAVGLWIGGLAGFIFAYVGTLTLVGIERALRR